MLADIMNQLHTLKLLRNAEPIPLHKELKKQFPNKKIPKAQRKFCKKPTRANQKPTKKHTKAQSRETQNTH